MKCRQWMEHCAPGEYGNRLMEQLAKERFERDASLDCVTVYEHAGWSLSWNRAGVVVGTANDAAVLPPAVWAWRKSFETVELVGYCRRADDGNHQEFRFECYYPRLAQAVA